MGAIQSGRAKDSARGEFKPLTLLAYTLLRCCYCSLKKTYIGLPNVEIEADSCLSIVCLHRC